LVRGEVLKGEVSILSRRGDSLWLRWIASSEIRRGRVVRLFGSLQDITDEHRSRAEIERLALRDPLTGLPNGRCSN
jgi:PAS domain-containing protein